AAGGIFMDAPDAAGAGGNQRKQVSQAALLSHVGGSYSRTGDVQVTQGNLPAAMTMYQKSLATAQQLAKAEPDQGRWQRDLSVYYNKIGEVEKAQHAFADALKSY